MKKDNAVIEESILRAAIRLLQDRKYRKASVIALSRQAGVSRSSFYRCFRNKEDVLRRILQRELMSSLTTAGETDFDDHDAFQAAFTPQKGEYSFREKCPERDSRLQRWFHILRRHDTILELFYINGYSELMREQVIVFFAGSSGNRTSYYKKVFDAGGILSLYEAWKKGLLEIDE